MKVINLKLVGLFIVLMILVTGCDRNFEEVNINPNLSQKSNPDFLLSNAQFISGMSDYHYDMEIVQQLITPFGGVLGGGNRNIAYDPNMSQRFEQFYEGPVKLLTDIIRTTENSPEDSNIYNIARIWRAYVFGVLVDTYGDVPYFEAGQAIEEIGYPVYDKSEDIYDDLLDELIEAVDNLDTEKSSPSADIFYNGNIEKWKRLGNSLILRFGMRYTKIDANKAQHYVEVATDGGRGGIMETNEDNVAVRYSSSRSNPMSSELLGGEIANYYVGGPFVEYLQVTNDPRLDVIAVKYDDPSKSLNDAGNEDTNPDHQLGMPYGYDENSISKEPNYPGRVGTAYKYSQFNRRTVLTLTTPRFLVTYSQTCLLLAEAALNGWINDDPEDLYDKGVRAHMEQMGEYGDEAAISDSAVASFLQNNAFDINHAKEQINNQYWVSSFLNGSEAWANFRRSGYPDLDPNPYPSADPSVTDFVRRLMYPSREISVNEENVQNAISNMGGNTLGVRVFWDQ